MIDVIRVDHDALVQIANRFNQQSEAAASMFHAARSTMEPLASGGWIGQGSDAFFAEMNSDILPAIQRLTDALAQAGAVTTQISALMQQADEEASVGFGSSGRGAGGVSTIGGAVGGGIGIEIGIGGSPIGIGIGIENLIGNGFGGNGGGTTTNDYMVPDDWLTGVTDSFGGNMGGDQSDYGIPRDWLDGVTGLSGAGPGAGSSGGGSGGGAASETAVSEPTSNGSAGGSSGNGSSEMDISDPYGKSGAANERAFRPVGAATGGNATAGQAAGLQYQSLGGMSSGGAGGTGSAGASAIGGGAVPTASIDQGGNSALSFALASATPFLALLGKAIKGQLDDD